VEKNIKLILVAQGYEIDEYHIYKKLALRVKDKRIKAVFKELSDASLKHYNFWKKITKKEVEENDFKVWRYLFISKLFGLTFAIKLMERSEKTAQTLYDKLTRRSKQYQWILKQEVEHEKKVIALINEDLLKYVGSIVLGLNDAMVEITGTLAGLTLALANNKLIGMTGLITGIAAALSMASSEYLSTKAERGVKKPVRAAIFTGLTYIITVLFLISPYYIFTNYFLSLTGTLAVVAVAITLISFYISVIQEISFRRRFLENVIISFGIAALSFGIGYLVNKFLGIQI